MWKVTLKGLLAKKLRLILTGLAISLGVAFVAGTMVLTDTIKVVFEELFADSYEGTDAVVRSKEAIETDFGTERPPISDKVLQEVLGVDGVATAEGFVQVNYAQLVDAEGKPVGNPGQGSPALGFSWYDDQDLNPFTVQEGGRPPGADGEVVIDRASAEKAHLDVGDEVDVLTQKGPGKYAVVGIAKFGDADNLAGASIVLFTPEEAQRINGYADEFDEIDIVAAEGVSEEELARRVDAVVASDGASGVEVLTGAEITEENQDSLEEGLGFFNTTLLVFAGIALFVGTFIIYNTFSIVVAQRTRELALLRALGASRRQVTASVLLESVVVGVGASAIGLGLGLFLARVLKALLDALGMSIPAGATVVQLDTVVISLMVGTVITVLSAVIPARKASRVAPVAAMRDVAVETRDRRGSRLAAGLGVLGLGAGLLLFGLLVRPDNAIAYVGAGAFVVLIGVFVLSPLFARRVSLWIGSPLPRLRGMTGTIARENAIRNPKRTAVTASALMIGVALVGFVTIFAASVKASVEALVREQITSDFVISGGGAMTGVGFSPEVAEQVAALPEVAASTGVRIGPLKVEDKDGYLFAADPVASEQLFDFDVEEGSLAGLGPDEIAVSRRKADEKGWELGEELDVTFGMTGDKTLTISAIYDQKQPRGNFLVSTEAYEENFRDQLDYTVYVKLADGVSPEEARAALEPIIDDYGTVELLDQGEFVKQQSGQIDQMVNLIYALLGLAVFIALIGIANTLALSIYERTREIGLLRAVGMSRSQVRSAVRWEAVIISLFGTALGLVVGLFFGYVVFLSLRDQGFSVLDVAPGRLVLVVVIGALAGIVAARRPARRAAKLEVLEAIAFE